MYIKIHRDTSGYMCIFTLAINEEMYLNQGYVSFFKIHLGYI